MLVFISFAHEYHRRSLLNYLSSKIPKFHFSHKLLLEFCGVGLPLFGVLCSRDRRKAAGKGDCTCIVLGPIHGTDAVGRGSLLVMLLCLIVYNT